MAVDWISRQLQLEDCNDKCSICGTDAMITQDVADMHRRWVTNLQDQLSEISYEKDPWIKDVDGFDMLPSTISRQTESTYYRYHHSDDTYWKHKDNSCYYSVKNNVTEFHGSYSDLLNSKHVLRRWQREDKVR